MNALQRLSRNMAGPSVAGTDSPATTGTCRVKQLTGLAWGAAGVTFLLGVIILMGGYFQLPWLTGMLAGTAPFASIWGSGLVLAAISLGLLKRETKASRHFGEGLAILVLALGLFMGAEFYLRFFEGLHPFPDNFFPITAFSFVGTGLALLYFSGRKRRLLVFSEVFAVGVLLTAVLGLTGNTYNMNGPHTTLAMLTAVGFLMLGVGILATRPERGLVSMLCRQTSGSVLARRLLPAALVIPFVLGWLRVRAEQAGLIELAFATGLLTTLMITGFVALIWRTAVLMDRTDGVRRHAEARLRESEQNAHALSRSLEIRVAERTYELEEKNLRLRRLSTELTQTEQRERRRLAALLHDDLQQLLVAASMDLNALKKRMRETSDIHAVERTVNWVNQATSAARNLTSELRPPALYEGGFVAALHWLAAQTWDRNRVRISIQGKEPANSIGDESNALLFAIVRELLFNIVKHAGVNEATVIVQEEGGRLRITVQDEGRGFEVETTANGNKHSGFGLFSIQERMLSIGGNITIESAPGKGTQILLEVPLAIETVETTIVSDRGVSTLPNGPPNEPTVSNIVQPVRVLVVDDHAMVRQGLATIINEDGRMTVVGEASDGLEAIEAVLKHRPDVVLIDLNMPRMNGIDATREICRRWPDSIVVGLSVQDGEASASLMLKAGAKAFLSKGGNADHMLQTIRALQTARA